MRHVFHDHVVDPLAGRDFQDTQVSFRPGMYVYHFREAFNSDFNINTDAGFEYVGRIHRKLNFFSRRKTNAAVADLKNFIEGNWRKNAGFDCGFVEVLGAPLS